MYFAKKSVKVLAIALLLISVFSYIGASISSIKSMEQREAYVETIDTTEIKEAGFWDSVINFIKWIGKVISDLFGGGDQKPSPSPSPSPSPTHKCNKAVYNSNSGYCVVKDASSGGYKDIGTQGWHTDWCLCYSLGYAYKIISNTAITTQTTDCLDYGTAYTATSKSTVFDAIRDQIIDHNKPVAVRLYNSEENTSESHWVLIRGIKESAAKKSNSELSYSDFYLVDSVGDKEYPSTSEDPKESNWQSLINNKNSGEKTIKDGDNRTLQKIDGNYKYYIPNATR